MCLEGTEKDSVPSKVPSVEVVRDFDVVKRLGTEASGVTDGVPVLASRSSDSSAWKRTEGRTREGRG